MSESFCLGQVLQRLIPWLAWSFCDDRQSPFRPAVEVWPKLDCRRSPSALPCIRYWPCRVLEGLRLGGRLRTLASPTRPLLRLPSIARRRHPAWDSSCFAGVWLKADRGIRPADLAVSG